MSLRACFDDVATLYHTRVCGRNETLSRTVLTGVMFHLTRERDPDSATPRERRTVTLTVPAWSDPRVEIRPGDLVVRGVGRAVGELDAPDDAPSPTADPSLTVRRIGESDASYMPSYTVLRVDPPVFVKGNNWLSQLRREHPELAVVSRVVDRGACRWLPHRRVECR